MPLLCSDQVATPGFRTMAFIKKKIIEYLLCIMPCQCVGNTTVTKAVHLPLERSFGSDKQGNRHSEYREGGETGKSSKIQASRVL